MDYKIDYIIDSGNDKWNEDRLLLSSNIIGVIDGATPIHKFPYKKYSTVAEWLVDSFVEKFKKKSDKNECDYKKICKEIMVDLSDDVKKLNLFDKPCFTSATVTISESKLKCEVIGDSYIYIYKKNGKVIKISDDRINFYAQKTVNIANKVKSYNGNVRQAIEYQKIENRRMMNVKSGYWVVAFDGAFENEFIENDFMLNEISKILICTDGFNRIVNEFSILNIYDFFESKISLNESLGMLREYENENYKNHNFPCAKKSDDATAVMILFNQN